MYAAFQLPQYDWLGSVSYRDGKKIFDLKDLYVGNRKKKEVPRYRCHCQADYANFFYKDQGLRSLILAWIDDRSRKSLGSKFLPRRYSIEVSAALKGILLVWPPLYAIWTDNSGECQGDCEKLPHKLKIIHTTTAPYNPQQNGKCERFWPTIEMARRPEDVPALTAEYNETRILGSLRSCVMEE
jgi:hypothetical protein